MDAVRYSLVVPVYLNEASIGELIEVVGRLDRALGRALEAIFVVDGSPDRSYERIEAALPASGLTAKLMVEMYRGFNDGLCRPETPITERGAITIEDFARGFAQAFNS